MFFRTRQETLDTLIVMGRATCAYGGEWPDNRCDCKYGATRFPEPGREANGCPELRAVATLLQAMTDDEWSSLIIRAGGSPTLAALFGVDSMAARLQRAQQEAQALAVRVEGLREILTVAE